MLSIRSNCIKSKLILTVTQKYYAQSRLGDDVNKQTK